jgi:ABC-type transport system substrate-binding protein
MARFRSPWVALALAPLSVVLSSCKLIPTEAAAVPPPAKAGARAGGQLVVGVTPPGGIDPVDAYEPVGKLISSTMCDTVVTLDPDTGQVREGLARSLVFSPDGTTLTFKMRRGLRFNDGTALKPADVDFSWRLLRAKSTGSYLRDLVEPFAAGVAGSVGGKEQGSSVLADEGVADKTSNPIARALNEADFQMSSTKGNGGAVRVLAEPAMAPISRIAYRRDPVAFSRNPVCVGPYKLAKPYLPGDSSITLVRNPGYYDANVGYTGGGRGYLDTIVFKIYKTADLAYAGYAKGEVDLVAVPPAKAADAARFGNDRVAGSQTTVEFLGVPTGLDPYNSTDLRRALSLALDRSELAAVLGAADHPATGFLPSALGIRPGDNAVRTGAVKAKRSAGAQFHGCDGSTPAHADVAAAQQALQKAKSAPGLSDALAKPLVMYVNSDGNYVALARAAAAQWKANLGLSVTVTPLRWADYLQKASQGPGFDGLFHMAWATDATAPVNMFNDAQAFLAPLFESTGSSNWSHWSSADFDFNFSKEAARKSDVQERGSLFRELEQTLCKELPMLPVAFSGPQYLVRTSKFATARESFLGVSNVMPELREIYQR